MRPWSYSKYSTYEDCPKKYWYRYKENVPSTKPDSPAATRGSDLHEQAENYLLNKVPIYPPDLQRVSAHAMLLKAKQAQPELKLGVTEAWEPCDFKDSNAYFRAIFDVFYKDDEQKIVHIQDWKSGQVYPHHDTQMAYYVATAAAYYPDYEFQTRLIYIDQGIVTKPKITRPERVKPIRLLLDAGIKQAEDDQIFPTRAGPICRFCDYSKKYNGPCTF